MNSKIQAYLKSTDSTGMYMRDVLSFYTSGNMRKVLLKQHITELEFFPSIQKQGSSFQVNFQYYNLCVIIEFGETEFEYVIYMRGSSANDLQKSAVRSSYDSSFSVKRFFDDFICLLKSDARLIKTSRTTEKKKKYKTISSICLVTSILIGVIPCVYAGITNDTIQFGPWFLVVMLVPFVISEIFDFLSIKK
jgi:hypothetical protein